MILLFQNHNRKRILCKLLTIPLCIYLLSYSLSVVKVISRIYRGQNMSCHGKTFIIDNLFDLTNTRANTPEKNRTKVKSVVNK